jgi:predicted transcriptional regulator
MKNQTTKGKQNKKLTYNPEKMSNKEIAKEYIKTQIDKIGTIKYAKLIIDEMRKRKITATEVAENMFPAEIVHYSNELAIRRILGI